MNDKQQPVIPGSSLRGMLRTLTEIVTFSKLSAVSKSPLIFRSVGGTTNHDARYRNMMMTLDPEEKVGKNVKYYTPRIRGGYMVKRGGRDWAIQPAKVIGGATYAHIEIDEGKFKSLQPIKNCQNAYEIYIKPGPYEYQDVRGGFLKIKFSKVLESDATPRAGLVPAALARSGWMNSKKSEAVIFERDSNADLIILTDEQVEAYQAQISKEQKKLLGENGALNDGQPVFYIETDGKIIFFGHARMFRMPYPQSPFDYVPDYARSEEEPKDPTLVDYAEAMFGYTRKVKNDDLKQRAYAGRISCSDAHLSEGQSDIWLSDSEIIPKILSGPKPTTFQHYLVQKEPDAYEIGRSRDGKPKYETRLSDYASQTPDKTVIRGHKFYWHKGQVGVNEIQETAEVTEEDTQHTKMMLLKAGVKFCCKVQFENLSDEELGALMWIFDVAANEKTRLKIGMGKPLGLGAIQIHAHLHISNLKEKYGQLFNANHWAGSPKVDYELADEVRQKFEDFMAGEINSEFKKHPRVRDLLMMLQWPGPGREWTRYMEIEHKEYKDRPVLPTPFGVWSKHKK